MGDHINQLQRELLDTSLRRYRAQFPVPSKSGSGDNNNSTNIDELRRRAHRQASTKLHREYELKDKAASTITMFIRRATIQRRINNHLWRKSLCRGASKYAATLLRPPLVVLPQSNPQPSSNPSLHNKKRKRRQSSRRKDRRIHQSKSRPRRRRPPKKFRTGNATSSTSFQTNDAIQPPHHTTASVPSTVEGASKCDRGRVFTRDTYLGHY